MTGRRQTAAKRPPPIKVLIGDPQRLFSGALAAALADYPEFEILAERPDTAGGILSAASRLRPDVVIFDFWLEGAATTEKLIRMVPACRVLPISWLPNPQHIRAALDAGAVGFLPQSLRVREVAEAVRRAHSGDPLVYAGDLHNLVEEISRRDEQLRDWSAKLGTLTARETEVLEGLGKGLPVAGVAQRLFLSPRTVNWYIRRMLAKTETSSRAEMLAMARYCGLIT